MACFLLNNSHSRYVTPPENRIDAAGRRFPAIAFHLPQNPGARALSTLPVRTHRTLARTHSGADSGRGELAFLFSFAAPKDLNWPLPPATIIPREQKVGSAKEEELFRKTQTSVHRFPDFDRCRHCRRHLGGIAAQKYSQPHCCAPTCRGSGLRTLRDRFQGSRSPARPC